MELLLVHKVEGPGNSFASPSTDQYANHAVEEYVEEEAPKPFREEDR